MCSYAKGMQKLWELEERPNYRGSRKGVMENRATIGLRKKEGSSNMIRVVLLSPIRRRDDQLSQFFDLCFFLMALGLRR